MSAPLILLYNLDNPRGSKLRRMCLPLKLRTRLVSKEEYALPLSVLAEGDGRAAPTRTRTLTTRCCCSAA